MNGEAILQLVSEWFTGVGGASLKLPTQVVRARRFSIPDAEWSALTSEARWAASQAVLDQAIADRIPIVLSKPATPEFLTGTYADEILYLVKQGYEIGPNAMSMVPKGR